MLVTSPGLAADGITAILLARLVRGLVFGIQVSDTRVELTAAAILFIIALIAAIIPARRAARLDPTRALRAE